MQSIPQIKSVMTPFPFWIDAGDDLERAYALMREHDIRHLPVMENAELVGSLSDRQIRSAQAGAGREVAIVGRVCTRPAYTVETSQPLDLVLREMVERHAEAAIVTSRGRLAGIFTTIDACQAFAGLLRQLFPRGGDGAAA